MFCSDISAPFLFFFSDSVPSTLLYYSHLPTAIIALFLGFFVFVKNPKLLSARLLFAIAIAFTLWSLGSLTVWVHIDSGIISFFWSMFGLLFSLISVFSLYFFLVFLNKGKDISLTKKGVLGIILLPVVLLTFTPYNIGLFDIALCEAVENSLFTNYYYFSGLIVFLWILVTAIYRYYKTQNKSERRQILLLTGGIEFFLMSFFLSSYIAALIDNYELEQYGLFGMTFFMGVLAYMIVKFKAFDIKLIGAQALVVSLILLIGSQFFFVRNTTNQILTGITLALAAGFGWMLIRSVKQEVKRKEELQIISDRLAAANERLKELDNAKSEFISIASHQLRTPLTAIKGYLSLILEGSYGRVEPAVQDVLNKVYVVQSRLTQLVEDLLSVSRIESGRIQYNYEPTQVEPLVAELIDMFRITAKDKKLSLDMKLPKHSLPKLMLDGNKIKEVVSNLIDNGLKYTSQGGVTVTVEEGAYVARIIVADTGIGIRPEDHDRLFQKFTRSKETSKIVASGAGLGLYVGKNFIEAHGGKIWSESEGQGKGSRFIIELPYENSNVKKEEIATFAASYKK